MSTVPDGWSAYEKLVMSKLDDLEQGLADVRAEVIAVRIDVATLKVKAGVWGAAAGMLPSLITAAVVFLNGGV